MNHSSTIRRLPARPRGEELGRKQRDSYANGSPAVLRLFAEHAARVA